MNPSHVQAHGAFHHLGACVLVLCTLAAVLTFGVLAADELLTAHRVQEQPGQSSVEAAFWSFWYGSGVR